MRFVSFARRESRCARFERCEDRLVFSSIPFAETSTACRPDLISPWPEWIELAPTGEMSGTASDSAGDAAYVRESFGFRGNGQTVAVIWISGEWADGRGD
jgi:hypothetical protein